MKNNNWAVSALAMLLVSFFALVQVYAADTPSEAGADVSVSNARVPTATSSVPSEQNVTVRKYSPWLAVATIAIAGFFGGFVEGLRSMRTYSCRFRERSVELGSLGDGLIGMAAAIAIFAFAESIFGAATREATVDTWFVSKIMAWGVLSGWAGTKLLDDLSSRAVQQLIKQETGKEVSKQVSATQSESMTIREAEQLHTRYLSRLAALEGRNPDPTTEAMALQAISKFRSVLQKQPLNREARNGLANAVADLGLYYQRVGDPREKATFEEAIGLASAMVAEDARFAKGYYNRACYKAVGRWPWEEVIPDLRLAIELDPSFREYALSDPDLQGLQNHEFWAQEIQGGAKVSA